MAYSTASTAIKPYLLTPRMAGGWSTAMYQFGGALWGYMSSADNVSTVTGSSYFIDGYTLGMRKYDHLLYVDTNGNTNSLLLVTSVTSAGNDPRAVSVTSVLTT